MTALLAVVVGGVVALVVHEAGHLIAARLLGAKTVRLRLAWPRVRVEADVPPDGWRLVVFLAAGPLANVVAAALAFATGEGRGLIVGLVNGAFALANLVPRGGSDGARLLALIVERRR